MNSLKVFLHFVILIICTDLPSQGLPPVKNFSPLEYRAENQNWAITQSADKVIYIANNQGLLSYNGGSFTLYPSPNETIMRSAKAVGNRIYTGCYMEFGFWQEDPSGILSYTSLSDKIEVQLKPDEEFWNILSIEDFILFQSLKRIYIYNLKDNSVSFINSSTTIPKVFSHNEIVYYQKINEGIYKIENGAEVLVYDDQVAQTDEVVALIPNDEDILFVMRHRGVYQGIGNQFIKWKTPVEDLMSKISIYSALQLENRNIALGTISHGLVILDNQWNLLLELNENRSLRNNTVLSLFEDINSNLWLGLDNGISFVNTDAPYRVYADSKGIVGSVYAAADKGNMMYLGTNQGLFYRNTSTAEDFDLVEGTKGQVWSLDLIGGTLFCGHHTGTYIVDGNRATKISDIPGTWKIESLDETDNLLLQGNYSGLYILEQHDTGWRVRNKIKGFNHSARTFEVYQNEIFVNHEYKGIFKISADSALKEARSVVRDTSLIGANSGMTKYKDKLFYAYKEGVFKYDTNSGNFIKDSILSSVYDQGEYVSGKLVVDDKSGYLWVFTDSNIHYITDGGLGSDPVVRNIPLTVDVRNSISGYESVTELKDPGTYLFSTSSGYITADISKLDIPEFRVEIDLVKLVDKNTDTENNSWWDPTSYGDFEHNENHLEISFYTPQYNKLLIPEYQYQIAGLYDSWSDWSDRTTLSLENLPYGDYEFKVRSKIGNKVSNNIASYQFGIARPWLLSNTMLALYVFLTVIGLILIHHAYRYYYRKKQKSLTEINKKEMDLFRLQSEKDIIKLKNDQLKKDFRNKNNELAASTMSIIKKNQLLNEVKKQLSSAQETDTKEIVRIIDRNLDQNDDWELFKEAFNNTDREFLKKLEKTHPNLSPNDIRLCAYLRLNLVTKEIAQLLNISPRSVEIKRYRLRKKMNLTHEENLVNYILKL